MCGGLVLDDIELRRNDIAFLEALGARTIPDPTTAGDFCRRVTTEHVDLLMNIVNDVRVFVWKQQSPSFFDGPARIDAVASRRSASRRPASASRAWTSRTLASGATTHS